MKPNPVKKTVEYCSRGTDFCLFYERNNEHGYGHCKKYNRDLTQPYYMDEHRPSWCTDETFVRAKLNPPVKDGDEFCYITGAKCRFYNPLYSSGYCVLMEKTIDYGAYVKRPEACRKLEVE